MSFYTGPLAAASNRAEWEWTVELTDPVTNALVDLTGSTINVAVRPEENLNTILTGSNTDGHITIISLGVAFVSFSRAEMCNLIEGSYKCGITVRLASGKTFQIFAGDLPVVDGVVNP